MEKTEERTSEVDAAAILARLSSTITAAREAGKRITISIVNGLHEWEEDGFVRRRFDGSCEIRISIPADRLGAAPVEWSEEKSRVEALKRAGIEED